MSVSINKNGVLYITGKTSDNILLNSATLTGKNGSTVSNGFTTGIHNGTSGWNEAYWPCSISASGNPLNGKVISISLDFMCTDISKISDMWFGFGTFNSSGGRVGDTNIGVNQYTVINGTMANNVWCRIGYVYTIPTTWTTEAATYRLQIKTSAGANGAVMYHRKIKVELNNYPTPYSICPSDIGNMVIDNNLNENYGSEFDSLAKIAENYVQSKEIIEI